jgi:hypothetical protein
MAQRLMRWLCFPVVVALLAAGCGSGGDTEGVASLEDQPSTSVAGTADAELEAEESILALVECLREEGIDLPDPEFDDAGNFRLRSLMEMGEAVETIDEEDLRDAFQACRHHLDGIAQLVAGIDRTDMEDRMVAYAACMRDNGFDMPDPDFGGGGQGPESGPFGQIDIDDPAFEAANEVCIGVFGETIGPGGFGPAGEPGSP